MQTTSDERYDDSSTTLGLSHGAVMRGGIARWKAAQDAEHEAAMNAAGIKSESDLHRIIPRNDGAHDALVSLLNKGYDLASALAMSSQTSEPSEKSERNSDILGASIESLMQATVQPDRRGSRSHGRHPSRTRPTDPLAVETSLRRQMVA